MTSRKQPTLHPLVERLLPKVARGEAQLATIVAGLERVPKDDVAWAVTSLLGVAVVIPAAAPVLIAACASQAERLRRCIDNYQAQREDMTRAAQDRLRKFQQDIQPKPQMTAISGGRSLGQLLQERGIQDVRAMAVSRASWVR